MSTYSSQVNSLHYAMGSYRSPDKWSSYWHQLDLVRRYSSQKILEIGVGEGVVARELKNEGRAVTTFDIAEDLHPDVVGSVTDMLQIKEKSYDLVLAAEILEHICFEDVQEAFFQIARVVENYVVVSVPHPGYVFLLEFKVPLIRKVTLFIKLPFFWKRHQFDGQHYWELGKKGYSVQSFIKTAKNAGLVFKSSHCYADDPARRYFIFSV